MLPNIQLPQDNQDDTQNMAQGPSQAYSSSQHNNDQQSSKGGRTPKSKKSRRMKARLQQKHDELSHAHSIEYEQIAKPIDKVKSRINQLLDNNIYTGLMTLVTLYALFGDDLRVITTENEEDPYFWGFSTFALTAFIIEIILQSIAQPDYFLGFFFWLDILSTASLILDIGWISNQIFDVNSGSKGKASSAASLAKASRASRVGTKAGRIVRVVRLIRLVRLYKHAQHALHKHAKEFEKEQKQNEQGNRDRAHSKDSPFQSYRTPNGTNQTPQQTFIPQPQPKSATPQNIHTLRPPNLAPLTLDMKGNSHTNRNSYQRQNSKVSPFQQEKDPNFMTRMKNNSQHQNLAFSAAQEQLQQQQQNFVVSIPVPQHITGESQSEIPAVRERSVSKSSNVGATRMLSLPSSNKSNVDSFGSKSFNIKNLPNKETKVGKTLSDLTTKRVILLVLLILISLPIFSIGTYIETVTSYGPSLELIYKSKQLSSGVFDKTVQNFIDFHKDIRQPLLQLDIGNKVYYPIDNDSKNYNDMRNDDLNFYSYSDSSGNVVVTAVSSSRNDNQINGILSIVRTLFIAVVLTLGAVQFTKDVEDYILEPIEKMLKKVTRIAENPLDAAQMEEKEEFALQQIMAEGNAEEIQKIKEQASYETVVLEKLIIRIGALLALGFGEAGSEIIASNMGKSGEVDPMLPGKKIMAIFGFCDIRNFTDATEVLQTGVMIFVNEIAQITHGVVDQYCGQANKNIGDAFLLVWKFREQDCLRHHDGSIEFLQNDITSNYADLSVISFLKIMAGTTLSNNLKKYEHHAGLKQRLKDYKVKMGFGLHFGWAIEGAIGSQFKIDASYLSPNVNMASRLEAATKQFGVGLLISGPLRNILTEKCQRHLRQIDCVTVKGSLVPLDLYTVDINLDRLYAKRRGNDNFNFSKLTQQQIKKKKIIDKMKRNQFKIDVLKGTTKVSDQFDKDQDLIEMRKEYTKEFYEAWSLGLQAYIAGKWFEASVYIKQTLVWYKGRQDGPSKTILEFIKEYNYMCPRDWRGFRTLTEK